MAIYGAKCAPAIRPPLSSSSDKELNGFLMYFDVIHYKKLLPPREGFERRRRRPSLSSALYIAGKSERRLY